MVQVPPLLKYSNSLNLEDTHESMKLHPPGFENYMVKDFKKSPISQYFSVVYRLVSIAVNAVLHCIHPICMSMIHVLYAWAAWLLLFYSLKKHLLCNGIRLVNSKWTLDDSAILFFRWMTMQVNWAGRGCDGAENLSAAVLTDIKVCCS